MEKSLSELEKERSEFSARATVAEEQVKSMQELMSKSTTQYQRKIAQLQRDLKLK